MERKATSAIMLTLLSTSMFLLASPVSGSVSGIELMYRTSYLLPKGWIYVLVEASVFTGIKASLNQYARDLESIEGFSASIYTVSTTDAAAIRSFLQQALPEGLVGCLLIGDIPQANYEWVDWEYTYFRVPTDFYFMDLDGVWSDTDGDGAYDTHSGDVCPEIWVGSLKPSLISGDKFQLLNNYFKKNHLYRTGKLTLPKRALAYIDDDIGDLSAWEYWVNTTTRIVYNETVIVTDPEITVASDYLARLPEGYEWIYLVTHGWPGSHTFWHHGWWDGTVYGSDYRLIDPPTFFYVLRACYTASGYNNVAGSCVFTDTYGLLAFGSKGGAWKPGPGVVGYPGEYQVAEFYTALSEGKCIGEAYLEDFRFYEDMMIEDPSYKIPGFEYLWQIVGDPSLHIKGYRTLVTATISIDPDILNLRSKGRWITAYIELPEDYNPEDIEASIIVLNGTVSAEASPTAIGDYDGDNIPDLMVKFNRTEISEYILSQRITHGDVTLTIEGRLYDETLFEGNDFVMVRMPGDVNSDGEVNILDLAIIATRYGKSNTEPYYDMNEDGKTDITDLALVATKYGKTYT